MTVGELAAICGIPSAVTVAIVGFFVWLLERSIVKRETARAAEEARREKAREKVFEKNLLASTNAALAVSEATARAVQRIPDAHCNGDMSDALEYAAKIKHEQRDFLAAQGIDNIF